jgi:hypothetical protein
MAEGGGASVRAATGSGAGGTETAGTFTLIRGGGGGAAEGARFAAPAGGGAISVAGAVRIGGAAVTVGDTESATGPVTFPNCRFTSSLIRGDKSTPHSGHANVTGLRTISGDASKAYLLPQSQWIFISSSRFGIQQGNICA